MHSVSTPGAASGGLTNALNAVTGNKQPGPPDHAKAWGWRAKQAEAAAAAQPPADATDTVSQAGATDAAVSPEAVEETAGAPVPPEAPSEADMESVILAMISDFSETSGADTTPLYDQVKALFA